MKGSLFIKRSGILIGIFMISILIRLPNINRPLAKHHEFLTAVVLQVMTAWDEQGISNVHYSPVMNFHRKADKYINNWASSTYRMIDDKGNYYYVSHPPFAYYLPYYTFKALGVKPGVKSLEIFSMVFHFLCALLIYLLVLQLLTEKFARYKELLAFAAFTVYVFTQATLWFHSNVYMSDILVMFFYILGTYLFLKVRYSKEKVWLILYLLNIFLMVYTSYLGVFFVIGLSVYALLRLRSDKNLLMLALLSWPLLLVAVALTIYQYSSIAGFDIYIEQMAQRYSARGSVGGSSIGQFIWWKIKDTGYVVVNYLTGYLPFLIILFWYIFKRRRKRNIFASYSPQMRDFAWISILPVVLLHAVLLNYSRHDFVALYGAMAICVFSVFGLNEMVHASIITNKVRNILIITGCVLSVGLYYFINRPGEISLWGDPYAEQMKIGEYVKEHASDNEVVFMEGYYPDPQTIYYARRNIRPITTLEQIEDIMADREDTLWRAFIVDGGHIKKEISSEDPQ